MARFEIALDRGDQRRRLHRRNEMIEEALLGAFEGRARGRLGLAVQRPGLAGDIGGLERRIQVVVDDLERGGIGVVDANLLGRELMLDQLVFDPLEGQRAGCVEAECLEVACEHLHRGDAAGLDRFDKLGTGGEREIRTAPQAEPLGVGEIVDRRRASGRDVEDARARQGVLQAQARTALLRGRMVAALGLLAGGVLHRVALVEHDHSVEVAPNQSTICCTRETFSSRASDRSVA